MTVLLENYLIEKNSNIIGYCSLGRTISNASVNRMNIRFLHCDSNIIKKVDIYTRASLDLLGETIKTILFLECQPTWLHGKSITYDINNISLIEKIIYICANENISVNRNNTIGNYMGQTWINFNNENIQQRGW